MELTPDQVQKAVFVSIKETFKKWKEILKQKQAIPIALLYSSQETQGVYDVGLLAHPALDREILRTFLEESIKKLDQGESGPSEH
ncbi:MAG TPA: hypothetical protein VEP50_02425 [bacterium]|nr:hypothetical protein [bacterium]